MERRTKGKRKKEGGERKNPVPTPTDRLLVMVRRCGWVGPETIRVKFHGCSFPLGGYFREVALTAAVDRLATVDTGIRKTKSSSRPQPR